MTTRSANRRARMALRSPKSRTRNVRDSIISAPLLRVAIYGRYSSDLQNPISTERQVTMCLAKIKATPGWKHVATYCDEEISGEKFIKRAGLQELLAAVRNGQVDVVLAEALDRVSRDQEHIAGIYKRLKAAGVELTTLQDGKINRTHVGFRGIENAEHQDALRARVRESTRLHVAKGKIVGLPYGHEMDRSVCDATGMPERGHRKIDKAKAKVVRRIFREYARGVSPRAIAAGLNADGISSPRGGVWTASSINGDKRRNTGILNNEAYIGRVSYGITQRSMDLDTENTIIKINSKAQWQTCEHPALRIIDQKLWNAVKARQARQAALAVPTRKKRKGRVRPEQARRPKYLLSKIVECSVCGGTYVSGSHGKWRCGRMYETGASACSNRLEIKREALEATVLSGLQTHLMQPSLVKEFAKEFRNELRRVAGDATAERRRAKSELSKVDRQLKNVMMAIKDGIRTPTTLSELQSLEARRTHLAELIDTPSARAVALPKDLAAIYHAKVANLREELDRSRIRTEAADALRSIISVVRLTPKNGQLAIDVELNIHGVLTLAANDNERWAARAVITMERVKGIEPSS
jgi:site-specific DNA recombinase